MNAPTKIPALIQSTDTLTGEQQTEHFMLDAFNGCALAAAFTALDEFQAGLEPGRGAGYDLLAWCPHADGPSAAAFVVQGRGTGRMLIAGCIYTSIDYLEK